MTRGRPTKEHNMNTEQEDRSRFQFNREEDRTSHEVDLRKRPSLYEMPDYDSIDYASPMARLQLVAPAPRIDPKYGKMYQYWADHTLENGRRVFDLQRKGWVVRDPKTVDPSYAAFATEQWHGGDVIMVANRHILMEIPEKIYKEKIEKQKVKENLARVEQIRRQHGLIYRDGEISGERMKDVGRFSQEVHVNSEGSERNGDINFAD